KELVEARERELGLGLDAERAQHAHAVRALLAVREERALAHARLAAHDEGSALPGACSLEKGVDAASFVESADKHPSERNRNGRDRVGICPRRSEGCGT